MSLLLSSYGEFYHFCVYVIIYCVGAGITTLMSISDGSDPQGLQYQYQYQYQKSILGPSIPIPIPILSKFWPSIPIPIPRPLNTNTRGLNTTKVVLNLNFSNSALQIFEADFTKIKNIFRFYFILLDFKTKFWTKDIFFIFSVKFRLNNILGHFGDTRFVWS